MSETTTRRAAEELRAAIPGWGADSDWADRPSVTRELPSDVVGAYGDEAIVRQEPSEGREHSIEHAGVTPVFGTSCPTHGAAGALRRFSYARWSEARAAHWLTLLAADRVDVVESSLRSWARGRPDLPFVGTGLRAEVTHHGVRSRLGRGRTDVVHQVLDPVVVVAPWAAAGTAVALGVRALRRRVG